MDIQVLCQALEKHRIDAKYINDSLVEINGININISGSFAQFGKSKFRFSSAFDFISGLTSEGLLNLSNDDRIKIKNNYHKLFFNH